MSQIRKITHFREIFKSSKNFRVTIDGFKQAPKLIDGRSDGFEMQMSEMVYKGF